MINIVRYWMQKFYKERELIQLKLPKYLKERFGTLEKTSSKVPRYTLYVAFGWVLQSGWYSTQVDNLEDVTKELRNSRRDN